MEHQNMGGSCPVKERQRMLNICTRYHLGRLALIVGCLFTLAPTAMAQQANFGLNLSGGKEPIKIDADNLEMRDKEGLAVFTGNVTVIQGDRLLKAGKMIVYYAKPDGTKPQQAASGGLGSSGIEKMEVSNKVYIKQGTQIATGDQGAFNGKTNVMILTGSNVVLTDGDNVATGCKLTAHMDSGKAFLESCSSQQKKGRVSVIMNRAE